MQGLTVGIVFSYESTEQLKRCLNSIECERHTLLPLVSHLEVVVVRTPSSMEKDLGFFSGQVIESKSENLAFNRNQALNAGETEGFYFIDPDCWLADGALTKLCQTLIENKKNSSIYACAGPNVICSENKNFERFMRWLGKSQHINGGLSQLVTQGEDRFDWHSPTCNILYWKPRLRSPYFSEQFHLYGEDLEFHFRQSKGQRKIYITSQAFVWHEQPGSWLRFVKKIFFYGTSQTQLLKLHPSSVSNPRLRVLFGILSLLALGFALPWNWMAVILVMLIAVAGFVLVIEMLKARELTHGFELAFSLSLIVISYFLGQVSGLLLPLSRIPQDSNANL